MVDGHIGQASSRWVLGRWWVHVTARGSWVGCGLVGTGSVGRVVDRYWWCMGRRWMNRWWKGEFVVNGWADGAWLCGWRMGL